MDWRDRAACIGHNSDLFFPIGTGPHAQEQIDKAKAVCHTCPVAAQCLDIALSNGYAGVWGGLDEDERRALSRQRIVPRKRDAQPVAIRSHKAKPRVPEENWKRA
jgi:WhiB family redox-sensing transcriptional regulator